MATIETIARRAGVSAGTVDRVIHSRGRVKPETEARVREIMKELNFQPNSLGRAFYMARQNNKIGVLVAQREADFQRLILDGVRDGENYAQQYGIQLLTETANPNDEAEYLAALERLLKQDIRALALRGIPSKKLNERLEELRNEGKPVLAYNEDVPTSLRDGFVGQNDRQSGTCAAYLMDQMCPHGGRTLIVGVTEENYSSRERINGFCEYFSTTSKEAMDLSHVIYGSGNHDLTSLRTGEVLRSVSTLTGVFVSGAGLSGVAHAVEDAGLAGQLKVVGYDATETNMTFLRRGTVQFLIDQDPHEQGYSAVRILTDAIFQDCPVDANEGNISIRIITPCNI